MCGIYGVIKKSKVLSSKSKTTATSKVLAGLKRLEYRGYDSWGVAALADKILVEKHVGKISEVKKLNLPDSNIAIGHTRWATHGGVTDLNAHPHLASDGSFALVQNGVVENFEALKSDLKANGYEFKTETDTEVIVRLIERELGQLNQEAANLDPSSGAGMTIELIKKVVKQLEGRSTVLILTQTGEIFAYRNGSPLIVGRDELNNIYFSSDVLSLSSDAMEYCSLENGEIINSQKSQQLKFVPINLEASKLDKAGFPHFMIKEIHEQGELLHQSLLYQDELFAKLSKLLKSTKIVYTLGAGSASFVADYLAFVLRQQGITATRLMAYEARSYKKLFNKGDICIAFSQSGETADTLEVIEWMRERQVKIVSLVNMPGSSLTQNSDLAFMLQVGPEVGVCSTKAYTAQLIWSFAISQLLLGEPLIEIRNKIIKFESKLKIWLDSQELSLTLKKLAKNLLKHEHLYVLGRGQLYAQTLEFALKMKEISYLHAEGFSGGELKHGVIALLEKNTPVVCLIANDDEKADMLSSAHEVKARGAYVIGVSRENNDLFDAWISLPPDDELAVVASTIPAQLLTYYMAIKKGLDPDMPRNLAKSVTVK